MVRALNANTGWGANVPICSSSGTIRAERERVALELKIARGEMDKVAQDGLEQTVMYMDRGGAGEMLLVILDRRAGKTWEERIWRRDETWRGHIIDVWEI